MSYYNEKYFEWQKKIGEITGIANQFIYQKFITAQDNVLDFGCGGGYVLSKLRCSKKMGIEINPEAMKIAAANGVETVSSVEQIADNWADKIISSHALEHTFRPLDELKSLYPKLKPGGLMIFVIPYERNNKYKPGNIDQHLYTWSEMCLGNLFTHAGFKVIRVEQIRHTFPPKPMFIMKVAGKKAFHLLSVLYGNLNRTRPQIRIVAQK